MTLSADAGKNRRRAGPKDESTPAWWAEGIAGRDSFLEAFRQMARIRVFEEGIQQQFLRGEVHGTTHLCVGQEAVSVGASAALDPADYVAGTYRGHGHALARGVDPESLAAELMGRTTGTCGGRAGSMNVISRPHGLIGCFGIVGGSMAAAVGAALSARRTDLVSVAFFGDGTANQAYFAECLNFAKVFELPVVFVCENNLYGEYTPMAQVTAGGDIAARAEALAIPAAKIDGNDIREVARATAEAADRARGGDGPTFLECATYRHFGHSRTDPGTYRPAEEVDAWKQRDPLKLARTVLIEECEVPVSDVDAAEAAAREEIAQAIQSALAAPWPDVPSDAEEYCNAA